MSKRTLLGLAAATALLMFGYVLTSGRVRTFGGDTPYYLALAEELAQDPPRFRNPRSPWPETPAMDRGPGWPFLLSLAIRAAPGLDRLTLVKGVGAAVAVANVLLVALLAYQATRSDACALGAGLAWAANPQTLALIEDGATEPAFILPAALGLAAVHRGGRAFFAGAAILGLACLVRQFFVLFPFFLAAVVLGAAAARRRPVEAPWRGLGAVLAFLLFLTPAAAWSLRNAAISGGPPTLSTLRGETFYGANNEVVANQLPYWGYWVMPDEIPGETPKRTLAETMTEAEVDRYYFRKGMDYVRSHWFELPRHLVGKLVRGYAPVPWVPSWASYAAFGYRGALYLAAAAVLGVALRHAPERYLAMLAAMGMVSVATTLVFYGAARFTYCFEPFLIPMIAAGVHFRRRPPAVEPA